MSNPNVLLKTILSVTGDEKQSLEAWQSKLLLALKNYTFQNDIPYFTLPFTLSTIIFINVNDTRELLYRVRNADMSYPEKQAFQWFKKHQAEVTSPLALATGMSVNLATGVMPPKRKTYPYLS